MAYAFVGGLPIMRAGVWDTGTYTEFAIDSAFILATSGDAMIWGFIAPESQTSASLTFSVFIGSVTGSPTDVRLDLYIEPGSPTDKDRPQGSVLATSGAVDVSALGGKWATFTISSVSLTKDTWYWAVIRNATATQASNYPSIPQRPAIDLSNLVSDRVLVVRNGTTTDGVTSDPSNAQYSAPCVVKLGSGTLFGNPWVKNRTYLGDNAHDRGMRVIFPEDMVLAGVGFLLFGNNNLRDLEIYLTGTNTQVGSTISHITGSVLQAFPLWKVPSVTLTGGQGYDIVIAPTTGTSGGSTAPSMSEATPPADVLAMQPDVGGVKWASITGTTPGSYTYDERDMVPMALYFDEASPAISGSGAGIIKQAGVGGGMVG